MDLQTPQRPVRVLRIIARLNVGGPSIQVVNLTRRLEPRGFDTTLLRGEEGPQEGTMDHLAEELDVQPILIAGLRRNLGLHDLRALLAIWRQMRRQRPTILHTHTAKAGALGRIAARLAGRARPRVVVHTFHGHVLDGEFGPRVSRAIALVERWLARSCTRVIAVSEEIRDDLLRMRVAPREKVEVVRLGFDLSDFVQDGESRLRQRAAVRARLGIPSDATVVTLIARVVKIKRVDRFLEMATLVSDAHKDIWFLVAGDGDRRASLSASELAVGLGSRLVWAGFERDIPGICFASDVVVLTSDNEDTPVCLIEAGAAGLPVVSTRVGGVETVVIDGQSGLVVEPDPRELAHAVSRLIDDEQLRASFGARARAHVTASFSIDRLVDDIDKLYRVLLSETT